MYKQECWPKKQLMEDEGLESVCQSSAASCRVGQGVEKVMKGGRVVKESRDRPPGKGTVT